LRPNDRLARFDPAVPITGFGDALVTMFGDMISPVFAYIQSEPIMKPQPADECFAFVRAATMSIL